MNGYPKNAIAVPDRLAVVFETEELTYAELDARAARLAHVLSERGIRPGDRVGIMLGNSIEFIETLAATAKLEAASLTLNWHLRAEELAWVLKDSSVGVLVTHVDLADAVNEAISALECEVIWVGVDYEEQLAAAPSAPVPYVWPSTWPVIYTSGTSGRPKGVVHGALASAEVMQMAQDGLVELWGYRPTDIHLVAGPLYHAGPAGYCNTTLYVGGTVVVMDEWDPREFLRLVETHRVTTTFLTPAHFIRILEIPATERARFDTSSLRHVLHAGAPCPRTVKAAFMDAFPKAEIWELYGMSEGGATRVSPDEWRERPGTVGLPWPGVEISIVDLTTGDPVPNGEDGAIFVRPAYGRFHYHNDELKTAEAWRDDSFTVGDVGHLDSDGYLYITDRLVDMVIRGGVNIYPRAIEEVLHRHPAVVDCAVFGVPDDRDGETVYAVVETRLDVDTGELDGWCRSHLDRYSCPSGFTFVDALPRDPNGKVLKRLLREAAWAGAGRAI